MTDSIKSQTSIQDINQKIQLKIFGFSLYMKKGNILLGGPFDNQDQYKCGYVCIVIKHVIFNLYPMVIREQILNLALP